MTYDPDAAPWAEIWAKVKPKDRKSKDRSETTNRPIRRRDGDGVVPVRAPRSSFLQSLVSLPKKRGLRSFVLAGPTVGIEPMPNSEVRPYTLCQVSYPQGDTNV